MGRRRLSALGKVAERIKGWRPAHEVLTEVEAVETIFPQLDVATRCGGWPIQRIGLLHGPSNHGKTQALLGLGLSFLKRGHFFFYVDAEQTTPIDWVATLMGEHAESDAFRAARPKNYEQAVDVVRDTAELIVQAREKGDIPPETTALIGVDSIRKLVPKKLLDEITKGAEKKSGKGVDGLSGRAGQYRAALNAAWMDELVPLLAHSRTGMVLVARERENPDAGMYDADYKVSGGRAVFYDSSLVIRVERAAWTKTKAGDVDGERLRGTILKTKVGGKDDKVTRFYFHTSNGRFTPEGFDRARDVLDMARECNVVEQSGGWFTAPGGQRWQGEHETLAALRKSPKLVEEIATASLRRFDPEVREEELSA